MGDLGKIIVAKGFKNLPKVKEIVQSGHTGVKLRSRNENESGNGIFFFSKVLLSNDESDERLTWLGPPAARAARSSSTCRLASARRVSALVVLLRALFNESDWTR